ncbi:hypothetical protein ACFPOE_08715 [Caenimonas terrae]|uniref:MAPEG family protein n=1 Tax=Caenimonas terrae TaxID=696074 RepID=A0ABW0NF59_9BURK
MQAMVFIAAATLCVYLLRSVWRMLVEVPDADQVWTHDVVDEFLTRSVSALLVANSGLFLVAMVR